MSGERRPEGVLGGRLRAGMGSVWESSLESKEGCAWGGALHISAREGEPACPRLGRAHQPLEDRVPAAGLTFPLSRQGKHGGPMCGPVQHVPQNHLPRLVRRAGQTRCQRYRVKEALALRVGQVPPSLGSGPSPSTGLSGQEPAFLRLKLH